MEIDPLMSFAHRPLSRVGSAATSFAGASKGCPLQQKPLSPSPRPRSRLSFLISAATCHRRSASHRRQRWRGGATAARRDVGVALLLLRVDRGLRTFCDYFCIRHSGECTGSASCRARDRSQGRRLRRGWRQARVVLDEERRAGARAWRGHGLFYGDHGGRRTHGAQRTCD